MIARFFFVFFFLSIPLNLYAEEPDAKPEAYSDFFNGDFVEFSFRYGLSNVSDSADLTPKSGELFEIGLRQALPMHLLDTRLGIGFESFSGENQENIQLYTANISGAFHPFYIALLFENWFAWVLASIYVELGIGGHYGVSGDVNDVGFSYTFGAGFDLPLWNPNHGWSMWLNGLYRYRRMDFDLPDREIDLHNHTGIVGLSIRWNGLLF